MLIPSQALAGCGTLGGKSLVACLPSVGDGCASHHSRGQMPPVALCGCPCTCPEHKAQTTGRSLLCKWKVAQLRAASSWLPSVAPSRRGQQHSPHTLCHGLAGVPLMGPRGWPSGLSEPQLGWQSFLPQKASQEEAQGTGLTWVSNPDAAPTSPEKAHFGEIHMCSSARARPPFSFRHSCHEGKTEYLCFPCRSCAALGPRGVRHPTSGALCCREGTRWGPLSHCDGSPRAPGPVSVSTGLFVSSDTGAPSPGPL